MKESARRIAKVSIECKIDLDETIYVGSFRGELMEVVYSWALGAKFSDICKMSDVFEGTIIRGMRRLDELLNEMVCASKSIGNTELEAKFVEGLK
jgi:ATP-dependent RNA helicase DOB1